ncbi:hypothetical protein EJB05_20085 [Eragrostis curvula]|uniref:Uncharacterized protein n=1 Tax=Eragrostis curvula TaxID=38414 RepID=A0A5J9UXT5_9POAL|nr:hypothetical protein EJB05_20085 [Eragrostis curvula]
MRRAAVLVPTVASCRRGVLLLRAARQTRLPTTTYGLRTGGSPEFDWSIVTADAESKKRKKHGGFQTKCYASSSDDDDETTAAAIIIVDAVSKKRKKRGGSVVGHRAFLVSPGKKVMYLHV